MIQGLGSFPLNNEPVMQVCRRIIMALPQLKAVDMAQAIAQTQFVPEAQGTGDEVYCTYKPYIGDYFVGKEQESILEEEVMFVIDTMAVGWILWHEGKCAEKFEHFSAGLMRKPSLPEDIEEACLDAGDDWQEARGVMFVTADNLSVVYKAATMGIRKAFDPLIMEVIKRAKGKSGFLYPKVKLLVDEPYKSKKGGKIYNPKFEIVSWHDKDGAAEEEVKAVEAPVEPEAKPRRRRAA